MVEWAADEIPLFPLNTVLFPSGVLPLRIFEPRYTDMISECMKASCEFGVVLIQEGNETGEAPRVHEVGTLARIVDWETLEDGLLGITTLGTSRFRLLRTRVTQSQLTLGQIERLGPSPTLPIPDECQLLVELLQRLWKQESRSMELPTAFEDAAWVSARLLELLPLSVEVKQHYLAENDPLAALHYLIPLVSTTSRA